MIKFVSLCLISFSLLIINNKRLGDTMIHFDKINSYKSCINLKEKIKNLNLKCEDLLNEEKEKNEKSPNHSLKELIKKGKKTNFISIRETGNYTKKIDKKDKVKLMNLVKALKNSEI